MFTDLSGTQVIANYVLFDGGGFFLRSNGALLPVKWGDLGYCYSQQRPWGGDCDGIVMNGVRYDSPTFAGFSCRRAMARTTTGKSPAAIRARSAGFKLAFGVGYSVNTDENQQPPPVSKSKDSEFFQAGGYAEHLATGLFVHAAYGEEDNNGKQTLAGFTEPNSHQWYVKGGIRRQWLRARPYGPLRRIWPVHRSARPGRPRGGRHIRRVHPVRDSVPCRKSTLLRCRSG